METKDIFGNEAKTEVKTAKSADVIRRRQPPEVDRKRQAGLI